MRREGQDDEIIVFDDLDRKRFPGFPAFAPIEFIPGLFEDVTSQLMATNKEIPLAESTAKKGYICLRSTMLHQALEAMLDVAGDEIVAAQLAA